MPKKKTSKSTAKRFWKTARGKIKYMRPGKKHLLACKSGKRKQDLRARGVLSKPETVRIKPLLSS